MKKGLLFLLVGALGFGFTSCDKIDEIENFAVDHKFEESYVLDIPNGPNTTYAITSVIDPSSNADFKENLSKISNYSVKKLTYRISEYTGDQFTMATAMIHFRSGGNMIGSPITLDPFSFQSMLESGNEVEIVVDDATKTQVQDMLLANNEIEVEFMGAVSAVPVKATVVVGLELEAAVKVN